MSLVGRFALIAATLIFLLNVLTASSSPPPKKDPKLYTADDWDRVAEQWMDDEPDDDDALVTRARNTDGTFKRDENGKLVREHQYGKLRERALSEMAFASVKAESKEAAEEIGVQWTEVCCLNELCARTSLFSPLSLLFFSHHLAIVWQLLLTDGIATSIHVVEGNRLLVVAKNGPDEMVRIQHFIDEQPQLVEFEWKGMKYPRGKKAVNMMANIPGLNAPDPAMPKRSTPAKGKGAKAAPKRPPPKGKGAKASPKVKSNTKTKPKGGKREDL